MNPSGGRSGTTAKCLIVRLDCSSPGAEESYYTDLLDWLKIRVDEKETIRYISTYLLSLVYIILIYIICDRASTRNSLWNSIAWTTDTGSDFYTKQGDSRKSMRLDKLRQGEPRRALRVIEDRSKPAVPQKRSASQSSMRITPPITSSNTVSGNQKPKQYSRLDLLVPPFGDTYMLTIT